MTLAPPHGRSFLELIQMREAWRRHHEEQDREKADAVFRSAGMDLPLRQPVLPSVSAEIREKLEVFGREWELRIAEAALRDGYEIYRARLLLGIEGIESFYPWLEMRWSELQHGCTLFFESRGTNSLAEKTWDCYFYFVWEKNRDPMEFGLTDAPGVESMTELSRIA